jgi:hypothetical protein
MVPVGGGGGVLPFWADAVAGTNQAAARIAKASSLKVNRIHEPFAKLVIRGCSDGGNN